MQLVAAGGVFAHHGQRIVGADFADRYRAVFIQQGADVLQEGHVFRLGLVVDMRLHAVRVDRGYHRAVAQRGRRIAAQLAVVEVEIAGVQAEAVDAPFQPKTQVVEVRALHRRLVEIQVGLAGQEVVQVKLAAARIPLPGRAAKHRQPIVGRGAVGLLVGPHIPVGLGIVAAATAFDEPGMHVGRVRQHLVDHDLQAQRVGARHQLVEIGQSAEQRIDVAIVGYVVAEILHRRREKRRDPHNVDAQAGDVVELGCDAGQVADAVAIAVQKAAWIDLIDDGAAPPVGGGSGGGDDWAGSGIHAIDISINASHFACWQDSSLAVRCA